MKVRIIGDIHAKGGPYQEAVSFNDYNGTAPDMFIQVGDFGVGFKSSVWNEELDHFNITNNCKFIRGNHDNPSMCKTFKSYIQDGHMQKFGNSKVMFIGGAWSIDYKFRTPMYDFWPDEQCSDMQFEMFLQQYQNYKPDIMITHDCPTFVGNEMFIKKGLAMGNKQHYTRTGTYLEEMFEIHQPKQWFFGHWHHTRDAKFGQTTFKCLGELAVIDVEF